MWAKVLGHPWSPAMVDFCPDFESFYWFDKRDSNVPVRESNCNKRYVTLKTYTVMALRSSIIKHFQTQYHVKFFADKNITRAWIKSDFIKPFIGNDEEFALKVRNLFFLYNYSSSLISILILSVFLYLTG